MGDDSFSTGSFVFPADHYGYVIWAAALAYAINFVQIVVISRLRTKDKIEYPVMYTDDNNTFNCAQRVHQVRRIHLLKLQS